MTDATRLALEKVDQILHEAGWDQPTETEERSLTSAELARISHACQSLLRPDHFKILTAVLQDGIPVEQYGREVGLNEQEVRQFLQEALHRLRDFVEVSEGCTVNSGRGEAAPSS